VKHLKRQYPHSILVAVACSALLILPTGAAETGSKEISREGLKETSKEASKEAVQRPASDVQMPVYEPGKKLPKGMAESAVSITISAEPKIVWNALTDFQTYPNIFKRIKTSEITRKEGDLVFLETYLKPQMFVKNQVQHTVSNIADSPHRINWKQLDGNFKHVDGSWDLASVDGGKTKLTYTLHVDAGTIVPANMVAFFLKFVQREVVGQVKQFVEKEAKTKETHNVSRKKQNSN
jgi:ribosome-associated toxin RatA of RatAB toxin-antitoxin module